jgi:hypothetical protein
MELSLMDALRHWNVRRKALEELGPLQYSSEQIFWCKKLSLMNALKIVMFITRGDQSFRRLNRFKRKPRVGSRDLAGNPRRIRN